VTKSDRILLWCFVLAAFLLLFVAALMVEGG